MLRSRGNYITAVPRQRHYFVKLTIEICRIVCYNVLYYNNGGKRVMKHIRTINKANLKQTAQKGGCGKCQASCQSACKTSCTVANQKCEK